MTDEEFAREREAILSSWPTGGEIDLDAAIEFHRTLPPEKNFARYIYDAWLEGRTILWPRTGQALIDRHVADLLELWDAGAELHATHADAYTRTQRYDQAQSALTESEQEGRSFLNGLPVVNLGHMRTRDVVLQTPGPNQWRTGTPDARLSAEIIFAAGFQAMQGGMLGTSLPFIKHLPIAEAIKNWQYVERLASVYEERGVDIHREYYGALMGMIMPPSIMCASLIFDALMAAEQGVKHMTLGVNNNLHMLQDVATLQVITKLAREYLDKHGYSDVHVTPLLHMWMGQFPHEEADAYALIGLGAVTAVMGAAAAVIVKTPHEAFGAPDATANADSTRMSRSILKMMSGSRYPESAGLVEERELIERETRLIVDRALELGDGAIAPGVVAAYAAGVMDVPFSPATGNAGKALPARDATGAVRFVEFGNLPFDDEIKDIHRRRVSERARRDGQEEVDFRMIVHDVSAEAFKGAQLAGLAS
jgi:methylaspartate mutase epsilon subunit